MTENKIKQFVEKEMRGTPLFSMGDERRPYHYTTAHLLYLQDDKYRFVVDFKAQTVNVEIWEKFNWWIPTNYSYPLPIGWVEWCNGLSYDAVWHKGARPLVLR